MEGRNSTVWLAELGKRGAEQTLLAEQTRRQLFLDQKVADIEEVHHVIAQHHERQKREAPLDNSVSSAPVPETKMAPLTEPAARAAVDFIQASKEALQQMSGVPYDLTPAIKLKHHQCATLLDTQQDCELKHEAANYSYIFEETVLTASTNLLKFWRKENNSMKLFRDHPLPESFTAVRGYFVPTVGKLVVTGLYKEKHKITYTTVFVFDSETTELHFSRRIDGYQNAEYCFFVYPHHLGFPRFENDSDDICVDLWKMDYEKKTVENAQTFNLGVVTTRLFTVSYSQVWFRACQVNVGNYIVPGFQTYFFMNDKLYKSVNYRETINQLHQYCVTVPDQRLEYRVSDEILIPLISANGPRTLVREYCGAHRYLMFQPNKTSVITMDETMMKGKLQKQIDQLQKQIAEDEKNPQLKKEVALKKILRQILCDFQTLIQKDNFILYSDCIKELENKYSEFFEIISNSTMASIGTVVNFFRANYDVFGMCADALHFIKACKEFDNRYQVHEPIRAGYLPPVMCD